VLCAAGTSQSQPAQSENALQMREQHLNTLAIAPGLLECVASGECASGVAGIFVDIAWDHACWSVRAAFGLKGTPAALADARHVPKPVLGENTPRGLQELAHRADVDVAMLVEGKVCPGECAVCAR